MGANLSKALGELLPPVSARCPAHLVSRKDFWKQGDETFDARA